MNNKWPAGFKEMTAKSGPLKGSTILYAPNAKEVNFVPKNNNPFWFGFWFTIGTASAIGAILYAGKLIDFIWSKI